MASQENEPNTTIDSLAKFISSRGSWTITTILQDYAPILGFLVIFTFITIGSFYFQCLTCSINQIVLMITYCFVISLFLLDIDLKTRKCENPDLKLLALYSFMPTIIFIVTLTVPLWSGLGKLWERTVYSASLPVNVFAGLINVFVSMIIYRTTLYASGWFLYGRLCLGNTQKSLWTLYV